MTLLESTRKLLRSRIASGVTLRDIARESNGKVEFEWLRKFEDGTAKNPTINRVQRLHDFLAKTHDKPDEKSAA